MHGPVVLFLRAVPGGQGFYNCGVYIPSLEEQTTGQKRDH